MPAGDGSGPLGMGPMTGRAAGVCAGYGVPGYANAGVGRGFGAGFGGRRGACGRGAGRGWRNMYHATGLTGWHRAAGWAVPGVVQQSAPTREQEVDVLKRQAEYLGGALEDIRRKIGELETAKTDK